MTDETYMPKERQEEYISEIDGVSIPQKVSIDGFPKGDLFARLHPSYTSFRDLALNSEN